MTTFYFKGPYYKSKLELQSSSAKFCQLIACLSVILQLKLTKLKLEVLKSNLTAEKKGMNSEKLTINWQNFAKVRLHLSLLL